MNCIIILKDVSLMVRCIIWCNVIIYQSCTRKNECWREIIKDSGPLHQRVHALSPVLLVGLVRAQFLDLFLLNQVLNKWMLSMIVEKDDVHFYHQQMAEFLHQNWNFLLFLMNQDHRCDSRGHLYLAWTAILIFFSIFRPKLTSRFSNQNHRFFGNPYIWSFPENFCGRYCLW